MRYFIIFGIAFLLIGCSPSYQVSTSQDEFEGSRIDRLFHNDIDKFMDNPFSLNVFYFDAKRYVSKRGVKSYDIVIQIRRQHWLFIEEGESLILLVDGQRIGFTGSGSITHRVIEEGAEAGYVSETAFYNATPEQLWKIANAKNVRVKIIGSSLYIDGELSSANLHNFNRYVNEYVTYDGFLKQ